MASQSEGHLPVQSPSLQVGRGLLKVGADRDRGWGLQAKNTTTMLTLLPREKDGDSPRSPRCQRQSQSQPEKLPLLRKEGARAPQVRWTIGLWNGRAQVTLLDPS
jgi:hypothetical protein